MKVLFVLAVALVACAYGEDTFQFPTDDPCILAKFEAEFTVNVTYDNKTYQAEFELPASANITVDGNCASNETTSTLNLNFNNTGAELVITIQEKDGKVTGSLQFILSDPGKVLKGLNYTETIAFNREGDEFPEMGTSNQSYRCIAPEEVTLSGNQTDINGSVGITFSNFRIQGFGVKGENFSDPYECAGDKSTTQSSTTIQTTTPIPIPTGVGNYTLKNGSDVCLRLLANISVDVQYENTTGHMQERTVMIPADADYSGTCDEDQIELTFHIDEVEGTKVNGTLQITFTKERKYVYISSSSIDLTFGDGNDTVNNQSNPHDVLSLSNEYYTCDEEVLKVGNDQVVFQELKVQAFDLSDGDFSTKGLDCHSAPPKNPVAGNYTVSDGNVTCISMSAALTLKIKYLNNQKKNVTKDINFEKDELATGQCANANETEEYIIVEYKKALFSVEFRFARDKSSAELGADETFNFYVQNVSVVYTIDEIYFNDSDSSSHGTYPAKLNNQKLFQTPSDKYYKCAASSTTDIDDRVSLVTQDLRLIAFNTGENPNLFGDNANECDADTETNSIVPIAVGAALAGLVVIVLIAYLIGRRRNHKGYESV